MFPIRRILKVPTSATCYSVNPLLPKRFFNNSSTLRYSEPKDAHGHDDVHGHESGHHDDHHHDDHHHHEEFSEAETVFQPYVLRFLGVTALISGLIYTNNQFKKTHGGLSLISYYIPDSYTPERAIAEEMQFLKDIGEDPGYSFRQYYSVNNNEFKTEIGRERFLNSGSALNHTPGELLDIDNLSPRKNIKYF
ncbi:uncharacterized protein ASCRUDRAFT_74863 [Ascoidea rubescens DSM 1968]|uniref:Uncharacterized protein n=1 Tax=Ascoidea rubescens DSM 1968 TaxID=1344418 RepID=A0A1D2VLR8_9ASCO|nr:hypothetical protein ASCRUDRAFT_74863 [Ascoidea rubescens DSM 1968]ODV62497.1 hypothetical protein ASCRUDRAFT_74863 [Ascoidea rubescens DSM 1968]